ncbi:uncharacterized protein LOC131181620 [Hevea brasiliensis]|uniref:uncharacterized protein LOC131181620 n=1 Tax=Hevea brasiliensis TaxID=3981 RepID=UPI0025FCB302|nr:uncharacterized protein LOC131181620 [Hevea brasiliensis]
MKKNPIISATMASHILLPRLLPLLATLLTQVFAADFMYPFNCSATLKTCDSLLYHINKGLQQEQVAAFYNVNLTQITPIFRGDKQDYFVSVPCSCQNINDTTGYFYDASYLVQENDTFVNVSQQIYSGQAWEVGDEKDKFKTGSRVPMHLLCGCVDSESQVVGTYTVQQNDTISDIASRLYSTVSGIQSLNSALIQDPNLLVVGWVLFVPMELTEGVAPAPR